MSKERDISLIASDSEIDVISRLFGASNIVETDHEYSLITFSPDNIDETSLASELLLAQNEEHHKR